MYFLLSMILISSKKTNKKIVVIDNVFYLHLHWMRVKFNIVKSLISNWCVAKLVLRYTEIHYITIPSIWCVLKNVLYSRKIWNKKMFDSTVIAVYSFLVEMDWVPNLGLNFRKSTQNEILGQIKLKPTADRGVRPINGICFLFGFNIVKLQTAPVTSLRFCVSGVIKWKIHEIYSQN